VRRLLLAYGMKPTEKECTIAITSSGRFQSSRSIAKGESMPGHVSVEDRAELESMLKLTRKIHRKMAKVVAQVAEITGRDCDEIVDALNVCDTIREFLDYFSLEVIGADFDWEETEDV